jgi:hypothetical protein
MATGRRQFTAEFKLEAVRLVESGRPVSAVARELQIGPSMLRRWRRQYASVRRTERRTERRGERRGERGECCGAWVGCLPGEWEAHESGRGDPASAACGGAAARGA